MKAEKYHRLGATLSDMWEVTEGTVAPGASDYDINRPRVFRVALFIHKVKVNFATLSLTSSLDSGGLSTPPYGRFTPGKDVVPIVYRRQGGPQRPVWTDAENLSTTEIRSPDTDT